MNHSAEPVNKTAAPVQLTAEQLLREAASLSRYDEPAPAKPEDAEEYKAKKRKEFEDGLAHRRYAARLWISYAEWEAEGLDFRRARSVFERALEVDYQWVEVWMSYINVELRNNFVNSARNLFDRVTHLLPRIDHFWLRYTLMEESLNNMIGAQSVFERWMRWTPPLKAWMTYSQFALRINDKTLAKSVLLRMTEQLPYTESFLRAAKLFHRSDNREARSWYQLGRRKLQVPTGRPNEDTEHKLTEQYFIKWAQFEEATHNLSAVAGIYEDGLRILGDDQQTLRSAYLAYQRRHGRNTEQDVDHLLKIYRADYYLKRIKDANGYDYDSWYSLIQLYHQHVKYAKQESPDDIARIREYYQELVTRFHPKQKLNKTAEWRRWFYVVINGPLFEELHRDRKSIITQESTEDLAEKLYSSINEVLVKFKIKFSTLWILWAAYHVRQGDLARARSIYGLAIGLLKRLKVQTCPAKLLNKYFEMELILKNPDRCKQICLKFTSLFPSDVKAWLKLIDLHIILNQEDEARQLFELLVSDKMGIRNQRALWQFYISFENRLHNVSNVRALFQRLYNKTEDPAALHSHVEYEWKTVKDLAAARQLIQRAIRVCKERSLDADRAKLINTWLKLEREAGTPATIQEVLGLVPKKVKKRRKVDDEDRWEEYTAYIFPEEQSKESATTSPFAILAAAKKWSEEHATFATS